MKEFNELGIKPPPPTSFVGNSISIKKVLGKQIKIIDYEVKPSKYDATKDCLHLQIEFEQDLRVIFIAASYLIKTLRLAAKEQFPFKATIVNPEGYFRFKTKDEQL